ncbi:MAG: immunoglobulin-like domain-containing protein, partial [Clostridium sp.]
MKGFRKHIAKALVISMVLLNINSSIGYAVQGSTSQTSPYSTLTNINNVVIFIDFNDTSSFNGNEIKARQVEGTYNDFLDSNNDGASDEDKISVKSYIYDLTKGRTTVNSHFYPKSTTSNGYNSFKAPKNKSDYSNIVMGSKDEKDFISSVFESVKGEINLSDAELDQDNDGKIDSVTFIFSGIPGSGSSMLRPHKTEITQNNPVLEGKKLSKYNIIGEGSNNTNIYNKRVLSTMVHEYLHMLGYPDLYRDGQNIKPVGLWDIMGDTVISPQLPLVYSRNTYGGANLNVEEITSSGTYTLSNASSVNTGDTVAFKVKSKEYPNEYFIIEYRKNDKKWDGAVLDIGAQHNILPGSGIIVYRINENINSQLGNNSNNGNHIYIFRPGETTANSGGGNINDAFLSQNIGRNSFGEPITNSSFRPNSIYFADGVNSGIEISQVGSSDSDNITFKIEIPNNEIVGDGSVANPYEIKNPRDLNLIANHPDKHFIVTSNIDLSGVEINPVDNFAGTIDGKGNTISNMTINSNGETTGFISDLNSSGVIKNISFENVNVKSNKGTSGTVVAYNSGTVDNVKVSGTLESSSTSPIGGIVGDNSYGRIINSTSTVNITSLSDKAPYGDIYVGGICGNAYNNISKNNYFSGTIVSQPNNKVGGIFGRMIIDSLNENTASIDNLWNKSNSNLEKGVGETIITDKNITLLDLEKGVVSVELIKDITLDKDINIYSNDIVKYNKALQNPTENLNSSNEAVVKVEGKKAKAIGSGNAKIIYNLLLGTNEINEEINVSVTGNELPEIIATNVEINVGEIFEPLKNVTASDKEDGDLTSKIKVIENTVDTSKGGTYKVVYEVEDSKGAKATKEIIVKVVQALVGMNTAPIINVNNVELKVGDTFDPMKNVSAEDKEDG